MAVLIAPSPYKQYLLASAAYVADRYGRITVTDSTDQTALLALGCVAETADDRVEANRAYQAPDSIIRSDRYGRYTATGRDATFMDTQEISLSTFTLLMPQPFKAYQAPNGVYRSDRYGRVTVSDTTDLAYLTAQGGVSIAGAAAVAEPTAATGEAGASGTFFGMENAATTFSFPTSNTYGLALGATSGIFGTSQRTRAINTPNFNIPAGVADFCVSLGIWLNPEAVGTYTNRTETILGVQGQSASATNGGAVQIATVNPVGSFGSGNPGVRRNANAGTYKFWGSVSTTSMYVLSTINLVPGHAYQVFFGRSGGVPKITFAQVSTSTLYTLLDRKAQANPIAAVQSITDTEVGTLPASTAFFNVIGSVGSGTSGDNLGFSGGVADLMWITGGFPTDQQAQDIARGVTKVSDISFGSVRYHNKLEYAARSGTVLAPAIDLDTLGNCTLIGSNQRGGRVIRQGSGIGITLSELYPGYTFPLAQGATTARVWFTGSCTQAGIPIQARLVDESGTVIPGFDWQTIGTSAVGAFRGYIASVPKNQVFAREVRLGTSTEHWIKSRRLMQVGAKFMVINQSEWNVTAGAGWSVSADTDATGAGHEISPSSTMQAGGQWLVYKDQFAARNTGTAGSGAAINTPSSAMVVPSRGTIGDGVVEIFNRVKAQCNTGLCLINGGKSGHPIDSIVFDNITVTVSPPANGAAGAAYTSKTFSLTNAAMRTATGAGASVNLISNFVNNIRPGTVALTFPGGVVLQDDPAIADTGQTTGNLYVSTDGAKTTVGTITYNGGTSATISIASLPTGVTAGTPSITYTTKQVTAQGGYTVLSPFTAWSLKDFLLSQLADELQFGITGVLAWQSDSNAEAPAATFCNNWGGKLDLYKTWFYGLLSAYTDLETGLAQPKFLLPSKSRDGSTLYATLTQVRLAQHMMASDSGNANAKTYVFGGGATYDNAIDLTSSPHPTGARIDGAARIGRHMGLDFQAFIQNDRTVNQGPKPGTPTWDGTKWRVPFTLGAGRVLKAGYAAGWTKQTGGNASATQAAGNSSLLSCWYVNGVEVDGTNYTASIEVGGQAVLVQSGTSTLLGSDTVKYLTSSTRAAVDSGTAPAAQYLYDDYLDTGYEPGRLAEPMA